MRTASVLALALCLAAVSGCHTPPPITPVTETSNWKPDLAHANELSSQESAGNGIEVGPPKIYDDASLRLMLDATRATLATMTGLNQGGLTASLGSLNGATISQTQFGLQISGGASLPTTASTLTGPTSSTTTNTNLPSSNASLPGSSTVSTNPTESSTITNTPTAPMVPVVPSGIAFTPPGSVSPSSLDMLNEQMQLSSAITSYELLLEGALSDRFVTDIRTVKPRVTLGFPISLSPPAAYRDAVAVVEVEVRLPGAALSNEHPAVTAILPQEKTYNVAAMTDHMTSIGAGVVVGTVGVGASGAWGKKSLYLVQDQDTVAMLRGPGADPKISSFFWEFRPVLGQRYVRGGMKQTFVQLALPELGGVDCFGAVRIHTYWRQFDRDTGLVGAVIAKSALRSGWSSIANYDLAPEVGDVDYQDLGDGTLAVHVLGRYLSGTYIQIGAQRFEAGKNLIVDDTGAKFVVSASAVAQWTGQVMARSGLSTPLLRRPAQPKAKALNQTVCANPDARPFDPPHVDPPPSECPAARILNAEVIAQSASTTQLRVTVDYRPFDPRQRRLLLAIGNRVYGLRDAPLWRDLGPHEDRLTVNVPTALLMGNPELHVFQPFLTDVNSRDAPCLSAWARLGGFFNPDSIAEQLVLIAQDKDGTASYLLYGNHLGPHVKVLVPDTGITVSQLDHVSDERVQLLTVTKSVLANTKKIVLQKADGELPLVLELPTTKPTPIKVSADSPVVQGTQVLEVSVEHAQDVTAVKFKDHSVTMAHVVNDDGSISDSAIRLTSLKNDGITDQQRSVDLTIKFRNGDSATLKLDVVAARVSVKSADSPKSADSTP